MGKMPLKEDEPQVGERHDDVEKKLTVPYVFFPPWRDLKFYIKKEENNLTP